MTYAFEWEKQLHIHLMEKRAGNEQIDRRFMFMKKRLTQGDCLPLPRGYIHVYVHYFHTTGWLVKATFYVEASCEEETIIYLNSPGHMTKMATLLIHGKNL